MEFVPPNLRWDPVSGGALLAKLVGSVAFMVLLLLVRALVAKALLPYITTPETRRGALVTLRNAAFLIAVLGLGAIWAEAVRTFAVSVLALGVAAVLATKELIQCLTGSILRTTTNSFSVGDRIELGTYRGDVIDVNFLTTTLLEVGPGRNQHLRTGRTVSFPNSKLLDSIIINESYMDRYVIHVFTVPWKMDADWERAEKVLYACAARECEPFLEAAGAHMMELEQQHGLMGLRVRPRVWLQLPAESRLEFLVRIPVPVGQQGRIEQAILRRFLCEYFERAVSPAPDSEPETPVN